MTAVYENVDEELLSSERIMSIWFRTMISHQKISFSALRQRKKTCIIITRAWAIDRWEFFSIYPSMMYCRVDGIWLRAQERSDPTTASGHYDDDEDDDDDDCNWLITF